MCSFAVVVLVVVRHRHCGWGAVVRPTPGARQPDQPHATYTLHGDHEIDGAEYRPPTVTDGFDPGEARQPVLRTQWRPITAEATRLHFEAQQMQPVAQAAVAKELAFGRQEQFVLRSNAQPAPKPAQD